MKKTVVAIVLAFSLIFVGALTFLLGMHMLGYDFKKLSMENYVTVELTVEEPFSNIRIEVDTSDVRFALSEDGNCKVVCRQRDDMPHSVAVVNGTLTVQFEDEREWYDHIGIFFESGEVVIYLPASTYNSVVIETDTGDVEMKDLHLQSLLLESDTGDVTLTAVHVESELRFKTDTGDITYTNSTCKRLSIEVDTGDIALQGVIVTEDIRIQSDTGDVELNACDASTLDIKTSTGDVSGRLLSPKTYVVDTSTGDVRVPNSSTGGVCSIKTSTGDIEFE